MQEVQRPLLTPDECLRMPGPKKDNDDMITAAGDMILMKMGLYYTDQLVYLWC